MEISFHAISAFVAALLAFASGVKTWSHFRQNDSLTVCYVFLVFFSMSMAMFLLVPPSLFKWSNILPPFFSISVFFLFLGVAFFLRIVTSFLFFIKPFERVIFFLTVSTGAALGVFTFLSGPSLEFGETGWNTVYRFNLATKIVLSIFVIIITSLFSGITFLRKALFISMFVTKLRGLLVGAALLLIGIGVLLVVSGEGLIYNFFIVGAFTLFFISVSLFAPSKQ